MDKRIAIFPGSFDPITKGHESVVYRALNLFDEIIVAIGVNTTKQYMFPLEQRKEWIESVFNHEEKVRCATYEGLTIDFCKKMNAGYILRGIRGNSDSDYEYAIASMNKAMASGIETVCFFSLPEFTAINARIVREILRNRGDVSAFVPDSISIRT